MTKIIKSLIVAGVLFFVAQFSKDAISGIADDTETGPHREWADKAHIAATSGKFDEAISCADKAIQIKPDYAAAFNTRGYAHNQKKLYDEAIKDFDMVVKIKPNYFAAYINRGSAKYYKGQYDSCIVDQSMAIKLDPSYSIAYLIRARAYVKKGADDLAIDDYNRVLELDPKDAAAYSERADIYRKKGENGLALEDMKKAILHDPKNENFKKNLAKLEQSSVSDVPVASDFSAPGGLPSSAAESTPQPAPSSSSGAESSESVRVLAPFSGYAVGDQCNQCDSSQSGVPWQPGQPEISGTVGAPELGQYEALLRHTMQGLRLLYGNLSATEESTFNAFWAPFFDHPTKPALEYFKKITPLLDETEVTLNNLDGTLSGLGQSLEGVFLAGGDSSNPANQIASIKYQDVKALRARLADLTKQIEALGNPPNPLAAKCAARKRHRKAIGGKDVWEFLHQAKIVGLKIDKNTVGGNITYFESVDKPEVELKWNGTKFTYNSINPHFENPCQPWTAGDAGQPQWGGYTYSFQGSGEMSADGLTVLSFHGVRVRRCCESPGSPSEQVVEQVRNFDYERPGLVLYQGKPVTIEDGRVRLVYSNIENPDLSGKKFIENSLVLEFRSYLDFEELNWGAIATNLSNLVKAAGGEGSSAQIESTTSQGGIPVGAPDAGAPGGNKKSSDPEQDPKVINEAIADHMALSEQARRDGERWAADAGKETNDDRRKDLERRAANFFANAQAEKDIADSLRTGTIVHTRTAWDERQHQELVKSVKKEIAAFAAENKFIANIPKVGNMVGGIEGVQMREEAQKRISEALKSPDRLQKLAGIYSDLQNKVVNQGEETMAKEQARVDMWENRISVAENVQTAAAGAIMLGALWAPAEIGMLAISYAGANGFVEGGVKGAVKSVVRSVSMKADVVISAYEGATQKDPDTGEPRGFWGAVDGAVWSIGTNVAMSKISGRLQKFKADYALAKQGAGGLGVKPVAKAKGPARMKGYDFKTPEERFKTELGSAKTPAEKSAVEKKYAIQVEREKMSTEIEGATKKAENDVRRGADPAKVKENYNKDLNAINEKYKAKETRNQEHEEVMKELGFNAKKDIKPTGSAPKNASSDMDFTPEGSTPHEAYQKGKTYVEAMEKRGHSVNEYGDRWVDNTNDSTIWKPGFGADKPGSSSFEAEVIFGTLPHSDKFGTKGGIEWTSSPTHSTDDPLGAVLANAGKASGAGLGNSRPKDLHTIGKSAVKAAEAAGIEVEPGLKAQIEGLKGHQTGPQAGVTELGANKATREKQENAFLEKVEGLMGRAYQSAKVKSDQRAQELLQKANASGNSDAAYDIRSKIGSYKAGNDAALATISQASPRLGKIMAPTTKVQDLTPEISGGDKGPLNFGGFAREVFGNRQSAVSAEPPPADSNDPAFAGLGDRCKEGAKRVQDKILVAKPGSEEARYLTELKAALEAGEKNPAEAVRNVRGLSGTELPAVLAQLGVPVVSTEKKA